MQANGKLPYSRTRMKSRSHDHPAALRAAAGALPAPLTHLGRLPVARFMRDYWQRRPLLIRQAFSDWTAPLRWNDLAALAQCDDVESRLVSAAGGRWLLRHGPFTARQLPARSRPHWTLLVQGVDLHLPAAHALLARFRFVADARLDDLMASYATDGGGVGPHVDSYDVFLLQAQGRRRWRIGRQRDLAFVPGLPLKILADFRPTREWVLEPGDMLYLPPGVAHEGVAVGGDCITCSIGFRAPRWRELLDPWLDALSERAELRGQYADPGAAVARRPGRLPAALVQAAAAALGRVRPGRADAVRALLAHLTEPKAHVRFAARRARSAAAFRQRAARATLVLAPRSRLIYDGGLFGINGEVVAPGPDERSALRTLADTRALAGAGLPREGALVQRLQQWYHAGWIDLLPERNPNRRR